MALESPDFQAFRGGDRPKFAHSVELECAKVLDYYGVPWEYEPRTFVLETDATGRVVEAFTPDFFLPDLDLYLECTVMRQSLTGRKRRKVRLARERAGANVEILFRRDFERLAKRWGLTELRDAGRPGERRFDTRRFGYAVA
jgi:hypothetical protein